MHPLKKILLYLQAVFYLGAGANHFIHPDFYLAMMPPYLPWPSALQLTAGACEMAFGAMLLFPRTRVLAAWGLIALLIAVFPANLNLALHPELMPGVSPVSQWVRLPFQLLFLAWAYLFTRTGRPTDRSVTP
ncbi:MAG: DoxX family protein [Bryobacteraceae bacterium]